MRRQGRIQTRVPVRAGALMMRLNSFISACVMMGGCLWGSDVVFAPPVAAATSKFHYAYAPDVVGCDVDRRFFIELTLDVPDLVPDVQFDATRVRLLDSRTVQTAFTPLGAAAPLHWVRRIYFATCGLPGVTTIVFSHANGPSRMEVPVTIWDLDDLRTYRTSNGTVYPRRFPLNGSLSTVKQAQMVVTPRGSPTRQAIWIDSSRTRDTSLIQVGDFSLEEFWRICPDTGSFALWSGESAKPDPRYGEAVYAVRGATYTYAVALPKPGNVDRWRITSPLPVGSGTLYPTNDWSSGDYHTGDVIDDGFNGVEANGTRVPFLGAVANWRGQSLMYMTCQACKNYNNTRSTSDLQLALAGFSRMALEMTFQSSMPQARRAHGFLGQNRRLSEVTSIGPMGNAGFWANGIVTSAHIDELAQAYDMIFPAITEGADTQAVVDLFARKVRSRQGLVHDAASLRRFIEEGIFMTWIQAALDGTSIINAPYTEAGFLRVLKYLGYDDRILLDIAYRGSPGYWQQGFIDQILGRYFLRDGMKFENPGGYNNGALEGTAADVFDVVNEIIQQHPERFPEADFPRTSGLTRWFLKAAHTQIEQAQTETTRLTLGDAGGLPVFGNPVGIKNRTDALVRPGVRSFFGDESAAFFERMYQQTADPKVAWALVNTASWQPSAKFGFTREQVAATASSVDATWRKGARLFNGHGISLLRSGIGPQERALVTHFGRWIGHSGDTTMGFHLDAFGTKLVTEWGYPDGWHPWYSTAFSQNAGRPSPDPIDQWLNWFGTNDLCVAGNGIFVSDSRSLACFDKSGSLKVGDSDTGNLIQDLSATKGWQRRLFMLVDTPAGGFYVVDLYRMLGGTAHWRHFETLDGPCEITGVNLTSVPGTLAGPNVPRNDPAWRTKTKAGFANLDQLRSGIPSASTWSATWRLNGSEDASAVPVFMRLTGIDQMGMTVTTCSARDPVDELPVDRRSIVWNTTAPAGTVAKSQVLNVYEAYRGTSGIARIQSLPVVSSGDEQGFQPACVRVDLTDGNRDYLIISASAGLKTIQDGTIQLAIDGRLGHCALAPNGRVLRANLLGGNLMTLTQGGTSTNLLTQSEAVFAASIADVEYDQWAVTLDHRPVDIPDPATLAGTRIYILRGGQRTGYTVKSASWSGNGTRLVLENSPILSTQRVDGFARRWLITGAYSPTTAMTSYPDSVAGGGAFDGARIIGRTGRAFALTSGFSCGVRLVDASVGADVLSDEFPRGTKVAIYDYGIGDRIEIPAVASGRSINLRPSVTSQTVTLGANETLSGQVTGTDVDGDTLHYAFEIPSGLSGFVGNPSGSFTIQASGVTPGTYQVGIYAHDDQLASARGILEVRITPAPALPVVGDSGTSAAGTGGSNSTSSNGGSSGSNPGPSGGAGGGSGGCGLGSIVALFGLVGVVLGVMSARRITGNPRE